MTKGELTNYFWDLLTQISADEEVEYVQIKMIIKYKAHNSLLIREIPSGWKQRIRFYVLYIRFWIHRRLI